MLDIDALMTQYKPEFPEILSVYFVDIEWESDCKNGWSGKIYCEYEDTDGAYFPIAGVENAGNGGANEYFPIAFDDFRRFKNRAMRCYPSALDPMDYACIYLELREAKKQ